MPRSWLCCRVKPPQIDIHIILQAISLLHLAYSFSSTFGQNFYTSDKYKFVANTQIIYFISFWSKLLHSYFPDTCPVLPLSGKVKTLLSLGKVKSLLSLGKVETLRRRHGFASLQLYIKYCRKSNQQQISYRPDKQNTQPSAVVAADDLPSCSTGHTAICCSWSFRIGPLGRTVKTWEWHRLLYSNFGLVDYFVCAGGFCYGSDTTYTIQFILHYII